MPKRITILSLLLLLLPLAVTAADFPLRDKFPNLVPITTGDLAKSFDAAVIVDVRTAMEFDVAHIMGATLVPVDDPSFLERVEKLRGKKETAPLVFYCNGRLCAKSYKATERAVNAGFANVRVYDSGVMNWLKAAPEKTVLLERTPAAPEKIIADTKFKAHTVPFDEFNRMSADPNTVVIDIRDNFQRSVKADLAQNAILVVKGTRIQPIPSDQFAAFVKANGFKDKQLLIADAVGVQIRWAQYFLEEHGYSDYHFLAGGVKAAVEAGHLKM